MVGDIRNIAVSRSVGDHRIFFLIKLQREKRGAAMKFTWCVKKNRKPQVFLCTPLSHSKSLPDLT